MNIGKPAHCNLLQIKPKLSKKLYKRSGIRTLAQHGFVGLYFFAIFIFPFFVAISFVFSFVGRILSEIVLTFFGSFPYCSQYSFISLSLNLSFILSIASVFGYHQWWLFCTCLVIFYSVFAFKSSLHSYIRFIYLFLGILSFDLKSAFVLSIFLCSVVQRVQFLFFP